MDNTTVSISTNSTSAAKITSGPILIQGAMDSEIRILANSLENPKQECICGFTFFIGSYNGHPVIVQKTFQGMTNAAAATIIAIEHFSPVIIINQGICGGHCEFLHRGDLLLGQNIINYSNFKVGMTESPNLLNGLTPIGCELFDGSKKNIFHSNPQLLSIAQNTSLPKEEMRIMSGTIASADAWLDRKDVISLMHETFNTCGEDMETASVAQLCESFHIPFLSLRCLSNTRVHDEEYDETVADIIQLYTRNVLQAIIQKIFI